MHGRQLCVCACVRACVWGAFWMVAHIPAACKSVIKSPGTVPLILYAGSSPSAAPVNLPAAAAAAVAVHLTRVYIMAASKHGERACMVRRSESHGYGGWGCTRREKDLLLYRCQTRQSESIYSRPVKVDDPVCCDWKVNQRVGSPHHSEQRAAAR
jgi:hypothetical protein